MGRGEQRPHPGHPAGEVEQRGGRLLRGIEHPRVQRVALEQRRPDGGRVGTVEEFVETDRREVEREQREHEVRLVVVPLPGVACPDRFERAAQARADLVLTLVQEPVVAAVDEWTAAGLKNPVQAVRVRCHGDGRT
ncbi:hypothetical protein JI76_29335 [Streptomyces anulatus]|nr:hypothetical protein JI76_29335 [Streptomyces anulatus]